MSDMTEANVRARISDTKWRIAFTFAACLAVLIGGTWIVAESSGPAAWIVSALTGVIGGIGALVFGAEFRLMFGAARRALEDLPRYHNDPEGFERDHGHIRDFRVAVFGRKRAP
jgi:hypothetical protein